MANHIDAQIKSFIARNSNKPRHGIDGCQDVFGYVSSVANLKRAAAENIQVMRFMNAMRKQAGTVFPAPIWTRFDRAAELRGKIGASA